MEQSSVVCRTQRKAARRRVALWLCAALATALIVVPLLSEDAAPTVLASFARDTLVATADGSVRIEELAVGDRVWAYDPVVEQWQLSEITEILPTYHDSIMVTELQIDGSPIVSSGNHPFYVTDGSGLRGRLLQTEADPEGVRARGWVRAGDLQVGDSILLRGGETGSVTAAYTQSRSMLLFDLRVEGAPTFAVGLAEAVAGDLTLVPSEPFSPPQTRRSESACFPAGTRVRTADGSMAIEALSVGDSVRSYDARAGRWQTQRVTAVHVHRFSGSMITATTSEGSVQATSNHPFLVSGKGWVRAGLLATGDRLVTESGVATVSSVRVRTASEAVFNITVADTHTFAVGSGGFVVHNKGGAEAEMAAEPMSGDFESGAAPEPMPSDGAAESFAPSEAAAPDADSIATTPGGDEVDQSTPASSDDLERDQRSVPEQLFLSTDDSNSTASPAIVRSIINSGRYVPPGVVRTYEFYNYYSFGYAPPAGDRPAIYANLAPNPAGGYSVQAVLRSPDRSLAELPPMHVVFLLDTSGSMAGAPFEIAKQFIYRFVDFLRAGDTIAVVGTSRYSRVIVDQYQVNRGTVDYVRERLEAITPNDITNLDPGIGEAYRIADEFGRYDGITRVVLISDGGANAGDFTGATISRYAADAESQGIYLTGVGVGQGFNDDLMNDLTDGGRGAYLFLDSPEEIDFVLDRFVSYFDLAFKDVRLGMQMPVGWSVRAFYGEQISTVREEIVPQYLAPSDQMIFQMNLDYDRAELDLDQEFDFEAEYTPLTGTGSADPSLLEATFTVRQMRSEGRQLAKAEAITTFAEGLKQIRYPLADHRDANMAVWDEVVDAVQRAASQLGDAELDSIVQLAVKYRQIVDEGEQLAGSLDATRADPAAVLGISDQLVVDVLIDGPAAKQAVRAFSRLGSSVRLTPTEGYRMLGLSSGPVGNPQPVGSGQLSADAFDHPQMQYQGNARYYMNSSPVFDRHTLRLELIAPAGAKSFSFDFNFFSAEYPDFVNQSFNDSFYAILEAPSTHQGLPTNISFDPDANPIEVDNNYFQRRYHPIPNTGTGFDYNGSTGWLRTSWPIEAGERFVVTFTIHDEGDAIFDSMAILDNFQFHEYEAVGTTDPLN